MGVWKEWVVFVMGFLGTFLGTDLATRLGANLAPRYLTFSLVYYANVSTKNLWYGDSWSSGLANEPLTFWSDGKKYMLIEESATQTIGYSSQINNAYWLQSSKCYLGTDTSPSGSADAYYILTDTPIVDINSFRIYTGPFLDSPGKFSCFVKRRNQGTASSIRYYVASAAETITNSAAWSRHRYVFHDGTSGNYFAVIMNSNDEVGSGAVAGDNMYWWGIQLELGQRYAHQPIPNNTGSPVTKAKDEAYWDAADIPTWAREGIRCYVITVDYSSVELAADAGSHVIWCCNSTAETITLSISGADNKPRLVGSISGTIILGDALTFSRDQKLCFDVVFNNGSNSVLIVSCATTGNGTFTGATTAAADGAIYLGMTPAGGSHLDGALSQLEPAT